MIKNRHYRRVRGNQHLDHSNVDKEVLEFTNSRVKIVPMSRTNYAYFIQDKATGMLAIVDPGDPDYIDAIAQNYFKQPISMIFLTHKHWDHSAGVKDLKKRYPNIKCFANENETQPDVTDKLKPGQVTQLGETVIMAYHTPGHTTGSTCFYIQDEPGLLFTGDTFFLGGMGAFFEGTGRTVLATINKLLTFPDNTLVFPGHEYSDTTLKFALYIEPTNYLLKQKIMWVVQRRFRYLVTIPSTLAEEKSYNPFLRIFTRQIMDELHARTPLEALLKLQEIRIKKRNEYRNLNLSEVSNS